MTPKPLPLLRKLARRPLPLRSRTCAPPIIQIPLPACIYLQTSRIRWNSTKSQAPKEPVPVNKHRNFYKEFGRPVAKVFFIAVFTYQFIYFFWAKFEKDEILKEKEEVKDLENQLEEMLKEKEKGKMKPP